MAAGLAALRPPMQAALKAELAVAAKHRIPLLVVTGGWSPAFTAVGDAAAALGGGEHVILRCPHHFPQLASRSFNNLLVGTIEQRARGLSE